MKKTITALTLATVLTFGTTLANAGIIAAGRADSSICKQTTKSGMLVSDSPIVSGIIAAIAGMLVSDRRTAAPACSEKNGMLVSDRADREGMLVSD